MIERFTISRDDAIYECFPDVCRTATGRLIVVYRENDSHGASAFAHLVYRLSDDVGRTWSDKIYLDRQQARAGVLFEWNCPRISQLSDGRIIILCDGYPVPPGEGGSQYESKVWTWTSSDDGASFAERAETPVCGIVPDRIVEPRSGRLLLGTHVRAPEVSGVMRQMVHISDDGGESWRGPITVCCTHHYDACEGGIVQLPGGELLCYMRDNSRTGRPGPKCLSLNDGED
ncbi:MAG: sialidase family protein [Armatimonadota bacterium]